MDRRKTAPSADPVELARVRYLQFAAFLCPICVIILHGPLKSFAGFVFNSLFVWMLFIVAGPALLITVQDVPEFAFLETVWTWFHSSLILPIARKAGDLHVSGIPRKIKIL